MCGIAGIINLDNKPIDYYEIKEMCDIMAYRGMDDEGYKIFPQLALGHRRLAIIDLTEKEYKQLEAFLFGLRGKEVKDDNNK